MTDSFDVIVVGGGAAGCVIAARLSERSGTKVLLLEAGRDFPPGREPADILDVYPSSYYNKSYMWPRQRAHWRRRDNSPSVAFDQGRVIGGGSSVMGMVALRGTPADYDEWDKLGASGWSFADVLPYFRRLERDLDFAGDAHGASGPIPIRRVGASQWPPLACAVHDYAQAHQIPHVADMSADFRDGYGSLPMSNEPGRRASAATCYLDRQARSRPNLTVQGGAMVRSLLLDGRRVTGVEAAIDGRAVTLRAPRTVLCGGALQSPALLMRSGIGPAAHLRDLGIAVAAGLPGVGANLQNHPVLFIGARLKPPARQPAQLRSLQATCLRFSSGLPGCPSTDLLLNIQSKSSWNALGQQIANLGPVLWKPFSRGRVSLLSADPAQMPLVEFNFLDDERDMARMMLGFRRTVEILAFPGVARLSGRPFPVRFTDRLRRLNRLGVANAIASRLIASLLDLVPGIADRALALMTSGTTDLMSLVADDERLADHIRHNVAGTFHVSGTCRMGRADDPAVVTDPSGKVRGVDGLRVADASVMPTVPRANTNIPVIMVAEKLADRIAREC